MTEDDDARNTLITELAIRRKENANENFHGFSDDRLVDTAAIVLFLMNAKLGEVDRKWLQDHFLVDHRRKLVTFVATKTGEPVPFVGSMSDRQLLSCAFAFKPEAANNLVKWSYK